MSEETKREEAEAKDEKNRPIEDAEAEKVVGGSGISSEQAQAIANRQWNSDGSNETFFSREEMQRLATSAAEEAEQNQ